MQFGDECVLSVYSKVPRYDNIIQNTRKRSLNLKNSNYFLVSPSSSSSSDLAKMVLGWV
jgi:hypothetical protein